MGKSLLVTATSSGAGKTLLIKTLLAYCQYHHPNLRVDTLQLGPGPFLDLAQTWQDYSRAVKSTDLLFVEGLGGLGTPVTPELIMADLARDWSLPIILMATVNFDTVCQLVAHARLAQSCQAKLHGIVLNCPQAYALDNCPIDLIPGLTYAPVLGVLPYVSSLFRDVSYLANLAANLTIEPILNLQLTNTSRG